MTANANQISLLLVHVHQVLLWPNQVECFTHVAFVLL
jgi:hypothetical protein